mgnify:CR=1 FL=1
MELGETVLEKIRKFQLEVADIEILKTTEGYGYDYADLPTILKLINPVLINNGIWYQHFTRFNTELSSNIMYTRVYNVNNEKDFVECSTLIDNEATLGGMNRFQVEGSAITYFRRYHITTILGLTTEEDTDAAGKRKVVAKKSSSTTSNTDPEPVKELSFVDTFKGLIEKGKTVKQLNGVLNMYKSQINNEDLKTINEMISEVGKK